MNFVSLALRPFTTEDFYIAVLTIIISITAYYYFKNNK